MTKVLIAYSPHRLGKDKLGRPTFETHILSTVQDVEQALAEKGYVTERAALQRDVTRFVRKAKRFHPHVVFNLCEHVGGDTRLEKNAVAVFELARLRFTGNGCLALALCLEKPVAKRVLRAHRLRTPDFVVARPGDDLGEIALPAIVKPSRTDGSLGITSRSVVKTRQALQHRVEYVHKRFEQPALVEHFVAGREFQVAVTGNAEPAVLAVAELSFAGLPRQMPRICSYSAKWRPATAYYRHTTPVVPARIRDGLRRQLEQAALRAYRILGLRGYGRVDFRVGRGKPQIIEVNPNPDISADAGMTRAAASREMSYADLIDHIVQLALE